MKRRPLQYPFHCSRASSRVCARVQDFGDDFLKATSFYDATGKPCVLVDGFRAIGVAGAVGPRPGARAV